MFADPLWLADVERLLSSIWDFNQLASALTGLGLCVVSRRFRLRDKADILAHT